MEYKIKKVGDKYAVMQKTLISWKEIKICNTKRLAEWQILRLKENEENR